MRRGILALALWSAMAAGPAAAESAFVTDAITISVFESQELTGTSSQRLMSGSPVEVLQRSGEAAQIKTSTGITGWIRASNLTTKQPAALQLEALQAQLKQAKSELSALSKSATDADQASKDARWMKAEMNKAREQVKALEAELKQTQTKLKALTGAQAENAAAVAAEEDSARGQLAALQAEIEELRLKLAASDLITRDQLGLDEDLGADLHAGAPMAVLLGVLVLGLVLGAWLSYAYLDKRLTQRFGGIKLH